MDIRLAQDVKGTPAVGALAKVEGYYDANGIFIVTSDRVQSRRPRAVGSVPCLEIQTAAAIRTRTQTPTRTPTKTAIRMTTTTMMTAGTTITTMIKKLAEATASAIL
ncbi:MAG: hypothetical protein MZV64_17895 [Ignavibacteriales bacterium]|nr:hypothetical protein [Ignavibacteriales bacterium]